MSLMIGILGRPKTEEKSFFSFSKSVTDIIVKYGHTPIGIIPPLNDIFKTMDESDIKKLYNLIDCCDGIILQGGTDCYQYDIEAIKYAYDKNIPVLGICLGMQSIALAFGSSLTYVDNHHHVGRNYAHFVDIYKHSRLYKILGTDKIQVNSRHKEMVVNPNNIKVVGSSDHVIEAVEKDDSLFFIGVQWHPEDMTEYDNNSTKIFDAFFASCVEYSSLK